MATKWLARSKPGPGSSGSSKPTARRTIDGHPNYVAVLHMRGPDDDQEVLSHRAFQ